MALALKGKARVEVTVPQDDAWRIKELAEKLNAKSNDQEIYGRIAEHLVNGELQAAMREYRLWKGCGRMEAFRFLRDISASLNGQNVLGGPNYRDRS